MDKQLWIQIVRLFAWVALILGGLMMFVTVLLAANFLVGSDEHVLDRHYISIDYDDYLDDKPIEVVTAPGVTAHMSVIVAESIQKHWRSDDLQFVVLDPASDRELAVMDLSRSDHWGQVLQAKEMSEPVVVNIDWMAPSDLAIGSTLRGRLTGSVNYPAVAGASFASRLRRLDMTVPIRVVTADELAKEIRSDMLNIGMYLGMAGAALSGIGWAILHFTDPRRRTGRMNR